MATKNLGQVAGVHIGNTPPENTILIWFDNTPSQRCHKVYDDAKKAWGVLDQNIVSFITYSELVNIAKTVGLSIGKFFQIKDKGNALALAITTTKVQYDDELGNILIDDLGTNIQYHVTSQNLSIDDVRGVFNESNKTLVFSFDEQVPDFTANDYIFGKVQRNNVWSLAKFRLSSFLSKVTGNSITWNGGFFFNFSNTLKNYLDKKVEDGKAKAGYFRGDYEGSPFMVESIPINYTEDTWVQSVRGRFVPVYQGTVDKIKTLTRSNTEYNILWRICDKGTWGTWNSMTDAPAISDTDLSMGLKDGDVSSAYIQMFTRKGGCYSVTGSRTGVMTGTMMVFCDSWGEHGIEQVLFTDASDIEGKIVHDISSSGHVDGEPRIYHRYYDIRQSGGKWGAWKSFTTGGGTTVPPYVAFDFGVLQEKIGSGRTQPDLDAFGLTEDVWAKIRGRKSWSYAMMLMKGRIS